eukprot:CAMPEP_0181455328 /NCGR_PEP_ID=MMETSP1110-20121109/30702_1 /TAXON_ID=174948 /ORGANISM="Symbiodinium sp., Strain CCMP421" /LENGTH=109 /DNA_ID=CAMNT_0023579711 /DNA_START=489 /DNA_END=818 /DNA_ORIENTATION=+
MPRDAGAFSASCTSGPYAVGGPSSTSCSSSLKLSPLHELSTSRLDINPVAQDNWIRAPEDDGEGSSLRQGAVHDASIWLVHELKLVTTDLEELGHYTKQARLPQTQPRP